MEKLSGLKTILGEQLGWHKSRIDFFAQALVGLFICGSINFRSIAASMPNKTALVDSRYKRIKRFFSQFEFDFTVIAKWLFNLFFSEKDKLYIAIDRTNWFYGKAKINIFMLSICHEGIAIPIFWTLLPKAGNSSGKEQISLVEKFINCFGSTCIEGLLADREFPNEEFISWLVNKNIPFYIRAKRDTQVHFSKKKSKRAEQLFTNLVPYQAEVFGMRSTIFGQKLYITASKNEAEELMIIITNANPKLAIAVYLRRWEIECLFQALKRRGFNFEETKVVHLERINKIVAFLAIAFAWAHKTGEWKNNIKKIPLKLIKGQRRPQYSFFKYGFDVLRDLYTNFKPSKILSKKVLRQLKPRIDMIF